LIDRTMDKQPASRVQTGAILADEVHQLLAKSPEGANTLSKTASRTASRISTTATMQRTRVVNRDAGYPRWLWPVVGVVVVGIGIGLWALLRQPAELPRAQVLPTGLTPATVASGSVDASAASSGISSDIIVPQTIEQQYGGDTQQWLDQADAYKKHGITSKEDLGRNLIGPDGSNAAELYHKVLAMQPDNQRAKRGLQDIAAFFTSFAQRTCDAGLFEACKMNAENGLLAEPDNAQLKALDQRADDAARGISSSGN
jgi:hypothetical protein